MTDQNKIPAAKKNPDPSWSSLYKAGGITAILYIVLALVVPAVMYINSIEISYMVRGDEVLGFIAAHRLWWMVIQTLVLGTSILAIITFVALFVAVKQLDKGLAAVGTIITVTCEILFMAYYPVMLGLVYLSDHFASAGEMQRESLAAAAEALLAQNNAFNPLYESLLAVGILILSIVMLKGVFPKWVAWLGIITAPVAFIALALWPVLGVGYFWWWLLFLVWFTAIGLRLYKTGIRH